MTDYAHLFNPFRRKQRSDDADAGLYSEAEVLEFASTAYYQKFVGWLEREAMRPLKIGGHEEMIQSAVRANTLREIRDTLVRRVEVARAATTGREDTNAG